MLNMCECRLSRRERKLTWSYGWELTAWFGTGEREMPWYMDRPMGNEVKIETESAQLCQDNWRSSVVRRIKS